MDTYIYIPADSINVMKKMKIAAFDIDGTIIDTKSGKKFAQNVDDWQYWDPNVKPKLRELHQNNYTLVFFTNQKGISSGKTDKNEWLTKVKNIIADLGVPVTVVAATHNDRHRKPAIGMWLVFWEKNNIQSIDCQKSFYCGDAAGRKGNKPKKKDFSDSDYKFALNIGIKFLTPEEFFQESSPFQLKVSGFNPQDLVKFTKVKIPWEQIKNKLGDKQIIINIGYPGSGKSTLTSKIAKYYNQTQVQVANQDTCKTQAQCIKLVKQGLEKGINHIIVDNTNPTVKVRAKYIELGKKYNYPVYAFYFTTPMDISQHNSKFRNFITQNKISRIPDVVYYTFRKRLEEPTLEEGFDKIIKIQFGLPLDMPLEYFHHF